MEATPWQTQHVRFENFIRVFIGLFKTVLLLLPLFRFPFPCFPISPPQMGNSSSADIDDGDKFLVLQWKLKHIKMAEKPHN